MLGLLSFVSCSNEVLDNPYAKVSSISIDNVSVLFQAAPSTGFVKVTAPKGITKVVSEQSWCTPTVNGSEVSVQVEGNSNVLGRSSLLTIYSGDDYAQVTVQQMGLIFALDVRAIVSSNDNALTKSWRSPVFVRSPTVSRTNFPAGNNNVSLWHAPLRQILN